MQLLPGEKIVAVAANGLPTLTSHRLWQLVASGTERRLRVIFLEDLCSCAVVEEEKTLWLSLAALSVLAALMLAAGNSRQAPQYLIGGGILAAVFWMLYRKSKKQYVSFNAASGRIAVELRGDAFAQGTAFIESVLAAKNDRFLLSRVEIRTKERDKENFPHWVL